MGFFFEEDGAYLYARPDVLARTTILRDRTILPGSTLVATETIYEDEAVRFDGYVEITIEASPYYFAN